MQNGQQTALIVARRENESEEAYQRRLRRLARRADTVSPEGAKLPYRGTQEAPAPARPKRRGSRQVMASVPRASEPILHDLRLQGLVPRVPEWAREAGQRRQADVAQQVTAAQTVAGYRLATRAGAAEHRMVTQRGRKARLVRIIA